MIVIQAFHTVRKVLSIECSGSVIGSLTATYFFYLDTRLLDKTTDMQNYVYSMKSLNNFQNVLPLCISRTGILQYVESEHKFQNNINKNIPSFFFSGKKSHFWHNSVAVATITEPT